MRRYIGLLQPRLGCCAARAQEFSRGRAPLRAKTRHTKVQREPIRLEPDTGQRQGAAGPPEMATWPMRNSRVAYSNASPKPPHLALQTRRESPGRCEKGETRREAGRKATDLVMEVPGLPNSGGALEKLHLRDKW